ncbi:MAG: diguanylate cyclase [Gammaproteobacteria bacterium]|nr:diguanylate cyclase [Gammaproteobacteria bacterium]
MYKQENTNTISPPVDSLSILVVDDDLQMRNSLKDLLEVYHMDCVLAEDGQEALELLKVKHFDLVLLDIKMPKVNGLQVMNEIQSHYQDTNSIILSGDASFENSRAIFRMGATDFLNKPYKPSELIELIHQLAEKKHQKSRQLFENNTQNAIDKTLMELENIIYHDDLTFANEIINSSSAIAFLWQNKNTWPVQFVSENVVNLLGYTANDFITNKINYTDLIHPEDLDQVISEMVTDKRTNKFKHNPYRLITKSGTIKWVDDSSSIVRDEQGKITHYQGIIIDVTERELAKQKMFKEQESLQYIAHHDSLTGLPNRLLLLDRLQQAIKKSCREKKYLALLYLDLNKFKPINDTLGHTAGDQVLTLVAKRLRKNVRSMDTIARIGGDEFVVLMESVSDIDDVGSVAHKLCQSLNKSMDWENHKLNISCSMGISLFPDDGESPEDLIKNADSAMYQSKQNKGNSFQFYHPSGQIN